MATQYFDNGTFTASIAMSAFRAVTITVNGQITYSTGAAAGLPEGIVQTDASVGDQVAVRFLNSTGTQKCQLSATVVTYGDTLFWAGLGQVATAGTVTAGKSMTSTSSNGSVVEFYAKISALN